MSSYDFEADVVVVGGGASGLPAALSAVEAGAGKVVLLEKRKLLGGTGRIVGHLFAVDSPAQKRLGIRHSADEIFANHMEHAHWNCDARLARNLIAESGEMVRWLESKGAVFSKVIASTGTIRTSHSILDPTKQHALAVTGAVVTQILARKCKEAGVEILMGTSGSKLLTDDRGSVIGIETAGPTGTKRIKAGAVILATGSISGNKEMLYRYFPEADFERLHIAANFPWVSGDGVRMAQEVGSLKDPILTRLYVGPHSASGNGLLSLLLHRPHLMMTNKRGLRFVDESVTISNDDHSMFGSALERQGNLCYAFLDDKILRDMIARKEILCVFEEMFGSIGAPPDGAPPGAPGGPNGPGGPAGVPGGPGGPPAGPGPGAPPPGDNDFFAKVEEMSPGDVMADQGNPYAFLEAMPGELRRQTASGHVLISDSWDEIATWMNADPAELKGQVERYNNFAKGGYDAEFLKSKRWLFPLSTPPYYVVRCCNFMDSAFGGIRISHKMEVLNQEALPIKGLYAVGIQTSGWLGSQGLGGLDGMCFGLSIYSGFTAGRSAAEFTAA